jgi:hypothetical protein
MESTVLNEHHEKHRQLQRQYQRDLRLVKIVLIGAVVITAACVAWLIWLL